MQKHESQRGYFAHYIYHRMKMNKAIMLICIDLGYNVFNQHFADMPRQTINTGASEQAAMDMAVGLALSGRIPFVYSITPFLLFRPFETLRTYIDHERIPVQLVGSGRDTDYKHDGFSHDGTDDTLILSTLHNIRQYRPATKEEVPTMVNLMITQKVPAYINLSR